MAMADGTLPTSQPATVPVALQLDRQKSVAAASRQTLLKIREELDLLKERFTSLATVKDAPVQVAATEHGRTNQPLPVFASLKYERNVSRQAIQPDAQGRVPMTNERLIVGKNGIRIEIYVVEGLVAAPATKSYLLPAEFEGRELQLQYYLEELPKDEKLKAAVHAIVENNVELLKKKLPQEQNRSEIPN